MGESPMARIDHILTTIRPVMGSVFAKYTKGYKTNPHAPKMTGNKPKYARSLPFLRLKWASVLYAKIRSIRWP